jgi:hypothetical protein
MHLTISHAGCMAMQAREEEPASCMASFLCGRGGGGGSAHHQQRQPQAALLSVLQGSRKEQLLLEVPMSHEHIPPGSMRHGRVLEVSRLQTSPGEHTAHNMPAFLCSYTHIQTSTTQATLLHHHHHHYRPRACCFRASRLTRNRWRTGRCGRAGEIETPAC